MHILLVLGKRGVRMRFAKWMLVGVYVAASVMAGGQTGPLRLQVDNLDKPLGIDDATPRFSWQLKDAAQGAKQTAYRVVVATRPDLLAEGKGDVWDSGKVASGQSLNVKYAGPALKPSTRYFWRVNVWGADEKEYAASGAEWWETGLYPIDASSGSGGNFNSQWKGQWIGWETPEEAAERKAPVRWIANP